MNDSEDKNSGRKYTPGTGIGVGIAIGVAIGVALDNIGLGIALGVAIGAGIDWTAVNSQRNKDKPDE